MIPRITTFVKKVKNMKMIKTPTFGVFAYLNFMCPSQNRPAQRNMPNFKTCGIDRATSCRVLGSGLMCEERMSPAQNFSLTHEDVLSRTTYVVLM